MPPLVDTVIEDPRWEPMLPPLAEKTARATLETLSLVPEAFQIVVMGCDDSRIAALNAQFRGKPMPTNVLSWPSEERGADQPGARPDPPEPGEAGDPAELGDIALSYDTCLRESLEREKPFEDHLCHLVVHAVLHLLGYDHEDDEDAALMEGTEIKVLAKLGLENPY
jgi:probable rRNA maturation factor